MIQYEENPERDTPEVLRLELKDYGGVSPDGQAIWRMVRAANRRIHCFGRQNHISIDTSKMSETARPTDVVPDRIEEGEFWIPRYPFDGWVLERWFPASAWGSREKWESQKAQDGRTRLLAAYPMLGGYAKMAPTPPTVWNSVLDAGDVKACIRWYNLERRNNPVRWDNYDAACIAVEEQERQMQCDRHYEELCALHSEVLAGTLRTVSKSADQFRKVVARHTSDGKHVGAAEKWG